MYSSIFVRLIVPSNDAQVNYLRCHVSLHAELNINLYNIIHMTVYNQQIQGIMGNLAYCLAFGTILAKMGRKS